MTTTMDAPATLDEARDQADAIAPPAPPTPDAKPKRTRKPRPSRARKPRTDKAPRASTPRATSLRAQLEEAITGVGFVVSIANQHDGRLIMEGAHRQAVALDALAKENPAVRAALARLLTTSVYAQLAMAFAPTLLGIAANHGMVPPIVGALAGMATSPAPAPAPAPDATATDPFAGVDLTGVSPADLDELARAFAPGGGDGVPRGVVAGTHAVG